VVAAPLLFFLLPSKNNQPKEKINVVQKRGYKNYDKKSEGKQAKSVIAFKRWAGWVIKFSNKRKRFIFYRFLFISMDDNF